MDERRLSVYNPAMSEHEDRTPLLMKVVLRQMLVRLREEEASLAQLGSLAGNLGWEEVSARLLKAGKSLSEAQEGLREAVEAAVELQAGTAHSHPHIHPHEHPHRHPHDHRDRDGGETEPGHRQEPADENRQEDPHRP